MNRLNYAEKESAVNMINRYYLDQALWPLPIGQAALMDGFRYKLEIEAGVAIQMSPSVNKLGQYGFSIDSVEIVDEKLWLMFVLKWS